MPAFIDATNKRIGRCSAASHHSNRNIVLLPHHLILVSELVKQKLRKELGWSQGQS